MADSPTSTRSPPDPHSPSAPENCRSTTEFVLPSPTGTGRHQRSPHGRHHTVITRARIDDFTGRLESSRRVRETQNPRSATWGFGFTSAHEGIRTPNLLIRSGLGPVGLYKGSVSSRVAECQVLQAFLPGDLLVMPRGASRCRDVRSRTVLGHAGCCQQVSGRSPLARRVFRRVRSRQKMIRARMARAR